MLAIDTIESCHLLATQLDERGLALVSKPGSLLSNLVGATYIDYNPQVTEGGYEVNLNQMSTVTSTPSPANGFSEHTARMEETADFLAKKLEQYLLHARTVAAPFIDEFAGRLAAQEQLIASTPDAGVNLKIRRGESILLEPSLMEAFKRSQEVGIDSAHPSMRLAEIKSAEEVKAMMSTGSVLLDSAIADYFATFEDNWFVSLYNNVFRNGYSEISSQDGIDTYIGGRGNVAAALTVFLIARRLWNAPASGTDMGLREYEAAMVAIRNQAAKRLCVEHERMSTDSRNGILIWGVTRHFGQIQIEVNADQYDLFLRNGGSVDALYGNQLQLHPDIHTNVILEKRELLEAMWQRQYNQNKSYIDQRRLLSMRESIKSEWFAMVKSCTDEEFSIADRHVAGVLVTRCAERVSLEDLDDLPLLALNIACKARWTNTADAAILLGMRRVKKNNPAVTSEEAATISLLEYLYTWVGDNFEVVSANKVNVFGAQDHMHQ